MQRSLLCIARRTSTVSDPACNAHFMAITTKRNLSSSSGQIPNSNLSKDVNPLAEQYDHLLKHETTEYNDLYSRHRTKVRLTPHKAPIISPNNVLIAPNSTIAGDVELWDGVSVWFNVHIIGDRSFIRIANFTNIQDGTVITDSPAINPDHDGSTIIGGFVTVGPGCLLHSCTIESEAVIGPGCNLSAYSYVEKAAVLFPGSYLPPGMRVPTGELWSGNPAKFTRKLTDEEIKGNTIHAMEKWNSSLLLQQELYTIPQMNYKLLEQKGISLGWQTPSLLQQP